MSNNKYYTKTFEKLHQEKKDNILKVATKEFALLGYDNSNINTVAKKCGISVGAMYSYFESKENLLLAVIEQGRCILRDALSNFHMGEENIFVLLERLIDLTMEYSIKYPEYVILYHSMTTESLRDKSQSLISVLEDDFRKFYISALQKASDEGVIRKDVDIKFAALYIDNLIVTLELSAANSYYKRRLLEYTNLTVEDSKELIKKNLLDLIKRSLL